MSKFNRYLATIVMLALTSWLFVTTLGLYIFGNDQLIVRHLIFIDAVCLVATWLCFLCESRVRWSTDSVEPTVIGD